MWIFLIGVQPEQRRAHLWAANVPGGSQRQDHRLRRRRHRRMGPGCFGYVKGLKQFEQIRISNSSLPMIAFRYRNPPFHFLHLRQDALRPSAASRSGAAGNRK